MDPRHEAVADRFARRGTLEAQAVQAILSGRPIVVPGERDQDYLEWVASREMARLTDNKRKHRFELRQSRVDGLVEQYRRLDVVLLDGGIDRDPDAITMVYNGQPVQDWCVEILAGDSEPVYITCHPDRWEGIRDELRSRGFNVLNGDAPFTRPFQNWVTSVEAQPETQPE